MGDHNHWSDQDWEAFVDYMGDHNHWSHQDWEAFVITRVAIVIIGVTRIGKLLSLHG